MQLILFCSVLCFSISATMSEPLVTVEQGTLLGKELKSEKNNLYHSYTGIPYAKAPVGDLRFKVGQYILL